MQGKQIKEKLASQDDNHLRYKFQVVEEAIRIAIGRNYLELEFALPQQPLLPNEPRKGITSKDQFQLTLIEVFYY